LIPVAGRQNIKAALPLSSEMKSRIWLERDYQAALRRLLDSDTEQDQEEQVMRAKSKRYGEITFPENKEQGFFYSDQFGLFPRDF